MKKAFELYYTKKNIETTKKIVAGASGIHVQFIRLYISTTVVK